MSERFWGPSWCRNMVYSVSMLNHNDSKICQWTSKKSAFFSYPLWDYTVAYKRTGHWWKKKVQVRITPPTTNTSIMSVMWKTNLNLIAAFFQTPFWFKSSHRTISRPRAAATALVLTLSLQTHFISRPVQPSTGSYLKYKVVGIFKKSLFPSGFKCRRG